MPYPAQTNRDTIIETARGLIERDGVDALSLAELAAALGVKAPSLYRHVASRAVLLQAVNDDTYRRLFQTYEPALDMASEPRALVRAVLHAHRAFAHAHPNTYVLAFTTTAPEERADARMLEDFAIRLQAVMEAIAGPEHAHAALRGALALAHGFVMLELKQQFQRGGDLSAAYEAAVDAYLAGW